MTKNWVKDINEMHAKFGVHEWVKKTKDSGELHKLEKFLEFRLNFLQEELEETRKAAVLDYKPDEHISENELYQMKYEYEIINDNDIYNYYFKIDNMMKELIKI